MELSKLKLNPNNPQKYGETDLLNLQNSISDFPKMMELSRIIYDPKTMMVIGGNKRLICLQKLKYKKIPDSWLVSAEKLTEEEKKKAVILSNIQFGEFDFEIIHEHYSEVDLEMFGIDVEDINIVVDESLESTPKDKNRGGFLSDGIKFTFGNVTKYITKTDEIFPEANEFHEYLISLSVEELNELICKILKLSTL